MKAEFFVGLRSNRLPYIGCDFKNGTGVRIYQSVYSEKLGHQYIRLEGSWTRPYNKITLGCKMLAGSAYNGSYQNLSAQCALEYRPCQLLRCHAQIAPWYDTSLSYNTCYLFGTDLRLTDNISLNFALTDIPDYRQWEDRLKVGVTFCVLNLSVNPLLSFDMSKEYRGKNIRPTINFTYRFQH